MANKIFYNEGVIKMKRIHKFNDQLNQPANVVMKKIAIHEAGHAAAILLGNQQKGLPDLNFQITIQPFRHDLKSVESPDTLPEGYISKIEGGRLIHTLPSSYHEATKNMSIADREAYERACDADIINLFAGPLAEAKYVALCDGEPISPQLINIDALHNYGGSSDLEIVNRYVKCFEIDDIWRKKKIKDLFLMAFRFINDKSNWLAVSRLADYILSVEKNIIEFNEIKAVI